MVNLESGYGKKYRLPGKMEPEGIMLKILMPASGSMFKNFVAQISTEWNLALSASKATLYYHQDRRRPNTDMLNFVMSFIVTKGKQ